VEDLAEAIRTHALSFLRLASMIVNDDDTTYRWYGPTLEQGTALPAVTVQQISSVDVAETHLGHSGLERARFQITVWSQCQLKLVRLGAEIERAFRSFRGVMGGAGGFEVGQCTKVGAVDLGREPGRNAYKRAIDISFLYRVK